MAMQGADTAQLRAAARRMRGGAEALRAQAEAITRALAATPWLGADAQRFRADWEAQYRGALLAARTMLEGAGAGLDRNADQQDAASAATNSTSEAVAAAVGLGAFLGGAETSRRGLRLQLGKGTTKTWGYDHAFRGPGWVDDPTTGKPVFRFFDGHERLYAWAHAAPVTLSKDGRVVATGTASGFAGYERSGALTAGADGVHGHGDGLLGLHGQVDKITTPLATALTGALTGSVGAWASGKFTADKDGLDAHGEVGVGAKGSGTLTYDGPGVDVTGTVEGRVGFSALAGVTATRDDHGIWHFGASQGVAAPLGSGAGIHLDIDPHELEHTVGHAAHSAASAVQKEVDRFGKQAVLRLEPAG